MKKEIDVVGAIITDNQNNIFCARRKDIGKMALKWEFPSGKVELGETLQESLYEGLKKNWI
ncbi:MAG: NUDIX domain-containing protein [Bacillota bacterium]